MLSKLLPLLIRKLAEGDLGEGPAKVYWWLKGKKAWTGIAIGAATYALEQASTAGLCAPCAGYVETLYTIAGLLIAAGLYDGAVRAQPPAR